MDTKNNILGCFVSGKMNDDKGTLFRSYIWGEKGLCEVLRKLEHETYGKDLVLILFQFYVNHYPELVAKLKEIERYRPKEKAVGIPIIVNDDNFFNKTEEQRCQFLKDAILSKMDLVAAMVKRRKFDTKIELLKSDIKHCLDSWTATDCG